MTDDLILSEDRMVDAVAVVGIGCRLPGGVDSMSAFWTALAGARDLITQPPDGRFDVASFLDPRADRPGKTYAAAGGYLQSITEFDAEYFGMSPREASRVDPQQRLLAECAVEAFDDAGIDPQRWAGSDVGVFTGASYRSYLELQFRHMRSVNAYTMSGGSGNNTSNRLSYIFDFRGPSMSIDTACSSSLTAVHQACEVLRCGRSPVALAGAVNLLLHPGEYVGLSKASMLSPSGRSRTFSAHADGYVRGEGAGMLVLRRLSDALADGDRIHGVILATAVNTDGRTQGLSLPSAEAQEALLRDVYGQVRLSASRVAYVEAHGTGTAAGDPLECLALGRALGRRRSNGAELPVGSVKTNIGHLEPAAGMAGLLKALLILQRGTIPPSLHGLPLNPAIPFDELGLAPVHASRPLGAVGTHCVVGVNSFGFGGANAHAILTGAPDVPRQASSGPSGSRRLPVVVSARTREALTQAAERMAAHLDGVPGDGFYDTAWTAGRRRAPREERMVVMAGSPAEAARELRRAVAGEPSAAGVATAVPNGRVGYVFSGNNSQWAGMGVSLLAEEPAFRSKVEEVDRLLGPRIGWSVLEELGRCDAQRLERTEIAQPLLFAVQVGLVEALARRGVAPVAVTGHSVGEVAAAYAAGALDLEAACHVISVRSQVQALTAGQGRMLAVGVSVERARTLMAPYGGKVELAAVNSAHDVTLAGDLDALDDLACELVVEGVFSRLLDLDYAFHTSAMEPIRESLVAGLAGLKSSPPKIPYVSACVDAGTVCERFDANYWWLNVRQPVQFADAVTHLVEDLGCDILVEIGPRPVLGGYVRRQAVALHKKVATLAVMDRSPAGSLSIDTTVARLVAAGADVIEQALPRRGRVVDLPAYPWQRREHWNGSPAWWSQDQSGSNAQGEEHELLGSRLSVAEPTWHNTVEATRLPWLADHRIGASVVLPAAAYVEMAMSAARSVFDGALAEVHALTIENALVMPWDDAAMDLTWQVSVAEPNHMVHISSRGGGTGPWQRHVRAQVRRLPRSAATPLDIDELRRRLKDRLTGDEHYRAAAAMECVYGPAFQVVKGLWRGHGEVLASYGTDMPNGSVSANVTVVDGALQSVLQLLDCAARKPFLPVSFDTVRRYTDLASAGFVHVRAQDLDPRQAVVDITFTDEAGTVTAEIQGCRVRRFEGAGKASGPARLLETVVRAAPDQQPDRTAVAGLPSPRTVLAQRSTAGDQTYAAAVQGVVDAVGRLTSHCMAAFLDDLTGEARSESFSPAGLLDHGIDRSHQRLLDLLLAETRAQGLVRPAGPGLLRRTDVPARPGRVLRQALLDLPEYADLWTLHGHYARTLPEFLRRQREGDTPFRPAEDDLTAVLNRLLRPTYLAAADLLGQALRQWPADRPLRVLEVGAAADPFASVLLPNLPADRTHYVLTGSSAELPDQARDQLNASDVVTYRPLDLGRDLHDQGFSEASFDVVVARHSLSRTRDLSAGLERLSALLVDGGYLAAVEVRDPRLLLPVLATGVGGWAPADNDPRGRAAWRDGADWTGLLRQHGFADVASTPALGSGEGASPCSVLLASREPRRTPPADRPVKPSAAPVSWVVAGEESTGSTTEALTEALLSAGQERVTATVLTTSPEQWESVLPPHAQVVNIVCLFRRRDHVDACTEPWNDDEPVERFRTVRSIVQACEKLPPHTEAHLYLVVMGASVNMSMPPSHHGSDAAVWGIGRSLGNEQQRVRVTRVAVPHDLAEDGAEQAAGVLLRELTTGSSEDEVILTAHGRFVSRIREMPPRQVTASSTAPGSAGTFVLRAHDVGTSYRLRWEERPPLSPGPGQVLIEVRAAALNYRDVMVATGMVPPVHQTEGVPELGLECAGLVAAVGPGVTGVAPGDRVFGLTASGMGSYTLASADFVAPVPDGMGFAEAATLALAHLTVQYSLDHLARLQPGETVLVHGAAGGVGLAALHHAGQRGAAVIATAGTEVKRSLLRLLGTDHVLDSRSLAFADEVRQITDGRGVDVVLNSLAGEAQARGLELLASGGRFIELGKRDFLENNPLMTRPFLANTALFGVDVGALVGPQREAGKLQFRQLVERVQAGACPPLPHQTYPAHQVDRAFQLLKGSLHTGKVVVTFDGSTPHHPMPTRLRLDPHGTYVVTGGLSGFGAATARWLACRGARHLALVGRRGGATPAAESLIQDLADLGARAVAHAADTADPAAVRRILAECEASARPVRGVIHAAMVLDDTLVRDATDAQFRTVWSPKAVGARVLDALTRGMGLEFFVVYSSVSALTGMSRQANYTAANSAMEALVHQRRSAGEHALAVQWSVINDTGIAVRTNLVDVLERAGTDNIDSASALAALEQLLHDPHASVANVGGFDPTVLRRSNYAIDAPRFSLLTPAGATRENFSSTFLSSLPHMTYDQALDATTTILADFLATTLHTTPDKIDRTRRLDRLGVDSLLAAELSASLHHHLKCSVTPIEVLNCAHLMELSKRVLALSGHTNSPREGA
ncbi:type I polyketide synthase [Streptomyces sp. DH12]|uniref:type I polyketide synthase n=1 Tax=Streptomyces sp. DH12 TaxID=2857010 RepID=UPI001E37D875|nr:type I polyketide synthase [Streptomyces sp. DH12]